MADLSKTYNLEDFLDDIERYAGDVDNMHERAELPVVIAVPEEWGTQLYTVMDMEVIDVGDVKALQIAVGEIIR